MHAKLAALHRMSRDFDGWTDYSLRACVDKRRCLSMGDTEILGRLRGSKVHCQGVSITLVPAFTLLGRCCLLQWYRCAGLAPCCVSRCNY